jgi:hypothetical protein
MHVYSHDAVELFGKLTWKGLEWRRQRKWQFGQTDLETMDGSTNECVEPMSRGLEGLVTWSELQGRLVKGAPTALG